MNNTKHELMEQFFALGTNDDADAAKAIKKKIEKHIAEDGKDRQLEETLLLISFEETVAKNNKFFDHCDIVRPILDRLHSQENWDFYDLRILSTTGLCIDDLNKIEFFLDKAIKILDSEYSDKPFYKKAKTILYSNPTHTLLKMKGTYYHSNESEKLSRINQLLDKCIAKTLELCEKDESLTISTAFAKLRKGIHTEDEDLIDKALALFDRHASNKMYKIANSEVGDYNFAVHDEMTERILKIQIAVNMRMYRKAAGLTMAQAAELIGITPDYLGQLESQKRPVPPFYLYKIADAFKITSDELMGVYPSYDGERNKERAKTHNLINGIPTEALEGLNKFIEFYIKNQG